MKRKFTKYPVTGSTKAKSIRASKKLTGRANTRKVYADTDYDDDEYDEDELDWRDEDNADELLDDVWIDEYLPKFIKEVKKQHPEVTKVFEEPSIQCGLGSDFITLTFKNGEEHTVIVDWSDMVEAGYEGETPEDGANEQMKLLVAAVNNAFINGFDDSID